MGIAVSAVVYPAFNQTVWAEWLPEKPLKGWRGLPLLLVLGLVLDGLVLWENPLVLYPLALVSAAGVLFLLTLIYSMVWLMLFKAENRFNHIHELALPLVGGVTLAVLQVALLDLGRFLLTGTWAGFNLG